MIAGGAQKFGVNLPDAPRLFRERIVYSVAEHTDTYNVLTCSVSTASRLHT